MDLPERILGGQFGSNAVKLLFKRVGRLERDAMLEDRGWGTVFHCRFADPSLLCDILCRDFAVRRVRETDVTSRDGAIRQIDTLLSLPPHPHVAPLLVAFSPRFDRPPDRAGKRGLYLVFERYPATLADRNAFKKLPSDAQFRVILDILSGLCHLHDHGVAHGNLRRGSIALDESGHSLLLDYGLAPLRGSRASKSDDRRTLMSLLGQLVGSLPPISGEWRTALEAFDWFAGPDGQSWLERSGMWVPAQVVRPVPSRHLLVAHLAHTADVQKTKIDELNKMLDGAENEVEIMRRGTVVILGYDGTQQPPDWSRLTESVRSLKEDLDKRQVRLAELQNEPQKRLQRMEIDLFLAHARAIGFPIGFDGPRPAGIASALRDTPIDRNRPAGLLWGLRNTPIALDRADGDNETIFTCPGHHNMEERNRAPDGFPEAWREWMGDYLAKREKHGNWMIWITGYAIGHPARDVEWTVGLEQPGEQGTALHQSGRWHMYSLNPGRPASAVFVTGEGDPDNGPYLVNFDTFEVFGYLYLVPEG
jgi:hypothetical protein